MKRVLVSEYLPEEHLRRLGEDHDVVSDPDLYANRPELLERVAGADAIVIRNRTQIDAELVSAAVRLQVVGRLGVGLDNIDMQACADAGVVVVPAVGANSVSVAEYVMGAMLVLARGVFTMTGSVVGGEWPRRPYAFGRELMGQTLGLVGFGSIAQHVGTRAAAFGMEIIACDPYLPADDPAWELAGQTGLEVLLAESDIISIHTPLTEETRNLVDEAALQHMKPTAILINTSRGETVDQDALIRALRAGVIGAAAIDVFPSEPLEPAMAARYAGLDNLLLTPHVAGNTAESVDRVASIIVEAVREELGESTAAES